MRRSIQLGQLFLLLGALALSNKKGALRKKLPIMQGTFIEDGWECPPEEECDVDLQSYPIGETTRMIQRFWRVDGRLVDFAIILEEQTDNKEWQEVAKIDCCHSQVHLHKRRMNKSVDDIRSVLREVTKQEDIEETIDLAINLMHDQFDQHVREWRFGY